MYLDEAKKILNQEYEKNYALAHTDYQKKFMDEKIKHSYQVLGVGNFLLKHEPYFANISTSEKSYYQAVVLLHDIQRFYEIIEKEKGNFIDHGVYGANFVSKTNLFCHNDAILPIRHHGHLIEYLYQDIDYQALSPKEKNHIKNVSYLIRDADKLANYYLLTHDFENMSKIFFVPAYYAHPHSKLISPQILTDFMAHKSVNKKDMQTSADFALMILGWIYDLEFKSSFIFLKKLHIIEKLTNYFSIYCRKEDINHIKKELIGFIENKLSSFN